MLVQRPKSLWKDQWCLFHAAFIPVIYHVTDLCDLCRGSIFKVMKDRPVEVQDCYLALQPTCCDNGGLRITKKSSQQSCWE